MSEKISWSLTIGGAGGAGLDDSGGFDVEAVTTASVTLDPGMQQASDLALQLANVDKIGVLAVTSSLYNGKVTVKAAGQNAKEVALTGPLVLHGDAVKLFGASLATLTVKNADAAESADLHVLIGRKLSA